MTSEKLIPAETSTITAAEAARKLEDEIRLEAYCQYEWRCESHEPGSPADDWLAAERAVLARHPVPAAGREAHPAR